MTRIYEIREWRKNKIIRWGASRFGNSHDQDMHDAVLKDYKPGDGLAFYVVFTPEKPRMKSPEAVQKQRIRNMKKRAAKEPLFADQIEAEQMKREYFSLEAAQKSQIRRAEVLRRFEQEWYEAHTKDLEVKLEPELEDTVKQSKLQKTNTDNPPEKPQAADPPAPEDKPGEATAAYAKKWNRDPAENFVTHCIQENTLEELQTNHQPEHADETDCEQWELTPDEWSDAIKAAIQEKQLAPQKQEAGDNKDAQASEEDQKKKDPETDLLTEFQTVEWNAMVLAATEMDEPAKKEKLTVMLAKLDELGVKLSQQSLKSFGISPQTVERRVALAGKRVDEILKSDKRYPANANLGTDNKAAQAAMRAFEAREWQMLEQGVKAKNAAQTPNVEKRESEQEKLFNSANQYFGAAGALAGESDSVGIPKELVQMRAEQVLNHMGNDPDLRQMRNPSPDAYRLSGVAVFITYVKELVEKLAKTIERMITAARNNQATAPASPPNTQPSKTPADGSPRSSEAAAPPLGAATTAGDRPAAQARPETPVPATPPGPQPAQARP